MARRRVPGEAGGPMSRRPGSSRAQTTIDFMIGIGVFLLVVGFVLGLIPGMIDPFSDSQETTLVADRLATQVAEGMLAQPDRPTILNETCTYAFFNESLGSGLNCPVPFDHTEDDLPERLGVQDRQTVNVSIQRDIDGDGELEILWTDGSSVGPTGHTELAIGPTVPDTRSVVAAGRTAYIDGKDVTVVVRVW